MLCPVSIFSGPKESRGEASLEIWSPEQRRSRALRALGISWAIAVASIFLPLVHFFLVPGFFILGPFIFRHIKKQVGRILSISGRCPFCNQELKLSPAKLEWPLRAVCSNCFEPLKIEQVQ